VRIRDAVAESCLPRHEGLLLLAEATGRDRAWLIAHDDEALAPAAQARYEALRRRRLAGEPIAYILGRRAFWTIDVETTRAALIPRPETELLVERALSHIGAHDAVRVLDLGTGTGAVALAIAAERPAAWVIGTDVSAEALALAARNAGRLRTQNVAFVRADWLSAIGEATVDLIVSNPPYVPSEDRHLAEGDVRFEPRLALAAGRDGLDALRRIAADASRCLRDSGHLLVEHGFDQGAAVRSLLVQAGLVGVGTARDLAGHERVTGGRRQA